MVTLKGVKHFRVYNRMYRNGKPTGKLFVVRHDMLATSKESAIRAESRQSAIWNKNASKAKSSYRVKTVSAKELHHGRVTKKRRPRNTLDMLSYL